MNKYLHKIATYTALILVSSLPFSVDAFADPEKEAKPVVLSTPVKPDSDKS